MDFNATKKDWILRVVWLLVGGLSVAGLNLMHAGNLHSSKHPEKEANRSPAVTRPVTAAKPSRWSSVTGPFGTLSLDYFPLECSDELFLDRDLRLLPPAWFLSAPDLQHAISELEKYSPNAELKSEMQEPGKWQEVTNGMIFKPSPAAVAKINPEERTRIYSALAKDDRNYSQRWPFRFTERSFCERFDHSLLTRKQIKEIRSLCYRNCGYISFCDLSLIQQIFDHTAFEEMIRVIYSTPSVKVRIQIKPGESVTNLAAYWGKHQSPLRIKPILESLSRDPDGGEININTLLPPFPRNVLYTYPDVERNKLESRMDCFFTGLNFFNETPDTNYLDNATIRNVLLTKYKMIQGRPEFGDLAVLLNARGDALHMAVVIAGDIVFTKNGATFLQPWTLMQMDEMLTYFPSETPLQIYYFREKGADSH